MRWIAAILVLYLTSCVNSKHSEIGQYVYVDYNDVIHTDRNCPSEIATNAKTKAERMANMQGVSFIDTCKLTPHTGSYTKYRFCPKCIDDDQYQHLFKIMARNYNKQKTLQ